MANSWQVNATEIIRVEYNAAGGQIQGEQLKCSLLFPKGPFDDNLPFVIFNLPESFVALCGALVAAKSSATLNFIEIGFEGGLQGAPNDQFHVAHYILGQSIAQVWFS